VVPQSELEAEQAHVDRAYERLDQLRSDTQQLLQSVLDQGLGGTHQFREERDVIVRTSLARLDQLDIGDQALCFGRIDRRADDGAVEAFHIGRLGISGEELEPLVVDWRAPVAEPFYRATGREPMGLVLRRHLAAHGRRIIGLEDERFGRADNQSPPPEGLADSDEDLDVGGPGALLAALEGARSGHMRDIVSTIQREQDEIIRSPLPGVLVVQGGPGTGKTAVALHRAAYLLYTHRFPLERQGVLAIGPNPLFLRYIEQVLPSLGESGVTLSTVNGLVRGVQVRGEEDAAVARLKGEARMVKVVARALRSRQRPLRHDAEIPYGAAVLRLTTEDSGEIVSAARRRPGTHNARRRFVEQLVVRRLADDYLRTLAVHQAARPRQDEGRAPARSVNDVITTGERFGSGGSRPDGGGNGATGSDRHPSNLGEGTGGHGAGAGGNGAGAGGNGAGAGGNGAGAAGNGAGAGGNGYRGLHLVRDLPEGDGRPADGGAGGSDDAYEVEHDPEASFDLGEFSRQVRRLSEVAELLDRIWPRLSAEELLHDLFGAMPLLTLAGKGTLSAAEQTMLRRGRSASIAEVPWTSADLALLDEARVLLGPRRRRAGNGGVEHEEAPRTYGHIVVDEAQDLSPMQLRMVARRSLSGSITVVGDIGQATGPWAPAAWDDVVAHLPGQRPSRLVELTVSYRTPAEVVEVAARVLAAAAPELAPPRPIRRTGVAPRMVAAGGDLAATVVDVARDAMAEVSPGTVAVLAPATLVAELALALDAAGLEASDPRTDGLGAPLSLLPVDLANGLEFDAAVVVEPSAVAAESPQGLRALYVALTRPTRRLAVVHDAPLPEPLAT
jgi:DNA helicase IV